MHARRSCVLAMFAAALALPATAGAEPAWILRGDGTVSRLATEAPQGLGPALPITGITAGEVLVGIDVRPQNGQLYGLGVNATANTGTLYAISERTGFAGVVGTASTIAMTDGAAAPVDLPDPATTGYGFDFNPLADRVRVTAGALNFRIDPNRGLPVDGDFGGGVTAGVNPDGAVNGGTTSVVASAYTNNHPNTTSTTLYSLDAASNGLYLQNPPNGGTQVLVGTVTLGGALDFTAINGFDIPTGVNVPANNSPATGSGFAALSAAGASNLYRINLLTAQATFLGTVGNGTVPTQGLAVQPIPFAGRPLIALGSNGTTLVRLGAAAPGTTTTVAIMGLTAGESLVGLDFRPQTGQLLALGINPVADNGTLYRLDPQSGVATAIGATGLIAFVDAAGAVVDLPDPAVADYGFDVNPAVDRVRVTARSGLNFRINPNTGAPVDGGAGAGTNPDNGINGSGSTGVEAAAYTNSYTQSLTGGVTTLYTLDAVNDRLFIQNPPNNGTQSAGLPLRLNGAPLDILGAAGFDIPPEVAVTVSNAPIDGVGFATLNVAGQSGLYAIELASANVVALGTLATPLRGLTVADFPDAIFANGLE